MAITGLPVTATFDNSLVAQNTSVPGSSDVFGTVNSVGFNLIGNADGSTGWVLSDLIGTTSVPIDPLLTGVLANNGGTTKTIAFADPSRRSGAGRVFDVNAYAPPTYQGPGDR